MRKAVLWGAVVLFAGSVGVVNAQERLPQASGFGTGVGESGGTGTRSQIWDTQAFKERLSQAETMYGRVLAIDLPGHKLHLETGGSSHDEGRAGQGALSSLTVYLDENTNYDQLKMVNTGDDVTLQVFEETTAKQPYGTGRKLVREITVLRGNEKLAGFGGLGQRPNPMTERAILSTDSGITGGEAGKILPGEVTTGITSSIGEVTGAAPCWQCEPQPGWGYSGSFNPDDKKGGKTDYGSVDKLNFKKGME